MIEVEVHGGEQIARKLSQVGRDARKFTRREMGREVRRAQSAIKPKVPRSRRRGITHLRSTVRAKVDMFPGEIVASVKAGVREKGNYKEGWYAAIVDARRRRGTFRAGRTAPASPVRYWDRGFTAAGARSGDKHQWLADAVQRAWDTALDRRFGRR